MDDGLYRVSHGNVTAGFVVENGVLAECAPILRKRFQWWAEKAERVQEMHFQVIVYNEAPPHVTAVIPRVLTKYERNGDGWLTIYNEEMSRENKKLYLLPVKPNGMIRVKAKDGTEEQFFFRVTREGKVRKIER